MKIDDNLSFSDFVKVVREYEKVELSQIAGEKIQRARDFIENTIKSGEIIYGVNTGFGKLSHIRIDEKDINRLQTNLIRSHAAGLGDYLPEEIVRGAILLLINSLGKGHSGVRKEIIQLLIDFLNLRITPLVPSMGSVGASGDLAPLSHIALVLLGEGEAIYKGKIKSLYALYL